MTKAIILPYKGAMPKIDSSAYVAPNATLTGDVVIGADSSIWFNTVVRGDVNNIIIGARTNIQDNSVIHVASKGQGTYIGDDVTVGHMALLHACTIGHRAFIGMQACIMDDAKVEDEAMVAAGALVTPGKVVGRHEMWAGRPAKKKRNLKAEEIEYLRY